MLHAFRHSQVHFSEYAQVGKGRDVGMQQIYKFEAKLSQGAAEQTLSRDVNRLGERLDFFRLLSFYFGGLGYYVGNFITVLTVTYVVYFIMALAVFGAETIGDRKLIPEGNLQVELWFDVSGAKYGEEFLFPFCGHPHDVLPTCGQRVRTRYWRRLPRDIPGAIVCRDV